MSDEATYAGLTADEIAALKEGEDETSTETTTTTQASAETPAEETPAEETATETTSATEETTSAAEPEADPVVEAAKPAPILVAEAPADADAQLAKIATDKNELLTKFDDGDITTAEYQKSLDALNKQEREIERAIDRANLAIEMEKTRAKNEWEATCNRFMQQTHPEYGKDQALYGQLDEAVRTVANLSSMKDASFEDILTRAHQVVAAMNPDKFSAAPAKPTAQKQAIPKPNLPPSLHNVPSAEIADTSGGKFAALDRLTGIAYEEALARLTPTERDQYMASAA